MVNRRAEELLRSMLLEVTIEHRSCLLMTIPSPDKLRLSRFATDDDFDAMMSAFDGMTKPTFKDPTTTSYIKFGGPRDSDERYNIRRGVLSLSGYVPRLVDCLPVHGAHTILRVSSEMASCFQPSVDAIKSAIDSQVAGLNRRRVVSYQTFSMIWMAPFTPLGMNVRPSYWLEASQQARSYVINCVRT